MFLVQLGFQPVLPKALRVVEGAEHFDKSRLRRALQELSQMSLITHNTANDSYSMHLLVHTWVRERPETSTAEQAVWCHAAATTLTQCILLPPLANTEAGEDFRRDLLPHVDHVRRCQQKIQTRILSNQKRRRRPWPVLRPQLDRSQTLQLAKFGFIYAQCGLWHDAETLLTTVYEFLSKVRGMRNQATIQASLFLAVIYRHLDKLKDAAALQDKVLKACIALWGEDDLQTLEVTDAFGVIRWQQGLFSEALKFHERAFEGFTKVKGPDDADTLRAMGNIGRIYSKSRKHSEAIKIHLQTVSRLQQQLGPSHQDTLTAMDNLAMAYLERTIDSSAVGEDLPHACRIMLEVVELRKKKLGKDHPITLWAIANLARVKNAQGDHSEAESLLRAGIVVAERNLGTDHIGTLYGKTYLGYVLLCQKQYQQAETILLSVVKAQQDTRPNHPDQLVAFSFLLKCYTSLGRDADAANTRRRMMDGLEAIGGSGHPWEKRLFDVNIALNEIQVSPPSTMEGLL
jgi:tetratricopeptide (TPR) repeat protein